MEGLRDETMWLKLAFEKWCAFSPFRLQGLLIFPFHHQYEKGDQGTGMEVGEACDTCSLLGWEIF